MKLIIGIGNQGEKYVMTRHNAGIMFVAELLKHKSQDCVIKKSNSFMNSSGDFVRDQVKKNKLNSSDLFIVHDDLDIKLGDYKIQFIKGPKDHNGIRSIEESIGTNEFWRVRIGVENRDQYNRVPGEEYVLEDFSPEEIKILKDTIDKAINDLTKNYLK